MAHRVYDFSRNVGWHEDEARTKQLAENERAREDAERKTSFFTKASRLTVHTRTGPPTAVIVAAQASGCVAQ